VVSRLSASFVGNLRSSVAVLVSLLFWFRCCSDFAGFVLWLFGLLLVLVLLRSAFVAFVVWLFCDWTMRLRRLKTPRTPTKSPTGSNRSPPAGPQ
jgi:membrane-bound metal-dependent hydrolase YbcI (DUF457 family)